eukprot:TRINITY_DN277_c1_g3_i1.p1 TRINITY_DN277_c1_g3~~TRINITY_DN277_c1_g3_i1.p1  ORF type:complete len:320 (+),score=19.89 TRINITY_DN277_c1_g3_i1:82-960(+)
MPTDTIDCKTLSKRSITVVLGAVGLGLAKMGWLKTGGTVTSLAVMYQLGYKEGKGVIVGVSQKDQNKIMIVSAVMGLCIGAGSGMAVTGYTKGVPWMVSLGLWTVGICVFHQGEFSCAALYRPRDLDAVAYLLPGLGATMEYNIAIAIGVSEFVLQLYFTPKLKSGFGCVVPFAAGVCMVLFAFVRIAAMAQCGSNFSHVIEHTHRSSHSLVTTGLYSVMRHPSYFGWFWWSVFSQLTLLNPFSTVAYSAVSYYFFSRRIPSEESLLADSDFFGDEYIKYRDSVPTYIPFIP